ncbi:MAG: hypothetical protein Fur0032_10210 [Terrimicrobiaceae bacterium]
MSRAVTIFLLFVAGALIAAVFSLRSCSPHSAGARLVFNATPDSVQSIRITNGGETFELKRRGKGWQIITRERKDQADPRKVDEILQAAATLKWFDRIPASEIRDKDDLSPYGLKSNKRAIELKGTDSEKLILGSEAALPGRIYARFDGSREIYLVPDSLINLLPANGEDLRDRRLSDLPASQVNRIIIRNNLGEVEMENSPTGWQLTKPIRAKADNEILTQYLNSLLGAPIIDFIADDTGDLGVHGITEGRSEVAFFVEGRDRPLVLRFGNPVENPPGSILAQYTGRDSVVLLPAISRGLIDVTPNRFRDKRLLPLTLDYVDRIRITTPAESLVLDRRGEEWVIQTAGGSRPVDPAAMDRWMANLTGTRAIDFVPRQPSNEQPARTIELLSVLSENTPEAVAGESHVAIIDIFAPASGRCVVSVRGASDDAIVDAALLQAVPSHPADLLAPPP